jgi:hypothetical protein
MRYFPMLLALFATQILSAQIPYWQWANSVGGTSTFATIENNAVATDKNGNIYVAGSFHEQNGAAIPYGSATIYDLGGGNAFLAKYNAAGSLLWVKTADQTTTNDIIQGYGVTVDDDGSAYLTGRCNGTGISFGGISLPIYSYTFVTKYDPAGNVIWAKTGRIIGGGIPATGIGVYAGKHGSVYATGILSLYPLTFDTIAVSSSPNCIDNFCTDVFITKYDSAGNVLWVKTIGGRDKEITDGIAVDTSGNFYVTGSFESPYAVFGTDTLVNSDSTSFVPGDSNDVYLVKYSPDGNVIWAKGAVGKRDDYAKSVAVDNSGNSYVTGYFTSPTITFGGITLTKQSAPVSAGDMFLVKYDSLGNAVWAVNQAGNGSYNRGEGVKTDAGGNVYLVGTYSGLISLGGSVINPGGGQTVCVVKYNPIGSVIWAIVTEPAIAHSGSGGTDLAVSETGEVAVIGGYGCDGSGPNGNAAVTFSSTTLTYQYCMTATASYIAKLDMVSGVRESSEVGMVSVYPNPTTDFLFITSDIDITGLNLYNLNGYLIKQLSTLSSSVQIDISQLPTGVYFADVITKQGCVKTKWLKM